MLSNGAPGYHFLYFFQILIELEHWQVMGNRYLWNMRILRDLRDAGKSRTHCNKFQPSQPEVN